METLVLDTSAIFNFGHRGQLEVLLKQLATQYRLVTTPDVCRECSRGGQKDFYAGFIPTHFEVRALGVRITGTLGLIEQGLRRGLLTDDECIGVIVRLRAGRFKIPGPSPNQSFAKYLASIEPSR